MAGIRSSVSRPARLQSSAIRISSPRDKARAASSWHFTSIYNLSLECPIILIACCIDILYRSVMLCCNILITVCFPSTRSVYRYTIC
jgi:hypothetical protein